MPSPTLSDVHVSVPLTNISIAYLQSESNFISERAFPVVPVMKQADRYYAYNRDAFFRDDSEERAPATESAGTGYTLDNTPTYFAHVYSLHNDVADMIRDNSDSVLNPDRDATMLVTQQLAIRREKIWVANFFQSAAWTGQQAGVTTAPSTNQFLRWDQAGSTPIEDVRTQGIRVAELTGYKPNILVLSPYVANQLVNNPEIVDRVKYTQLGFLDYQLLAKAFGVDEVLVPFATNNTAAENTALSMSFMYGKSALLAYRAPAPGLMTPSAGYTFAWQGYLNQSTSIAIKKFRMEHLEADRIEGKLAFDMKVIGADLGVFFSNAIS